MTAPQQTVSAAARRTVQALRRSRAIDRVDDLAVATVMFTSHQLDDLDPEDTSPAQIASLLRAHLAATKVLLGRDAPEEDTGGINELLAVLAAPPEDNAVWPSSNNHH
jgi:hypothetical protein